MLSIPTEIWVSPEARCASLPAMTAIHGDNAVQIVGGEINIEESYEGIEGLTIDITGGDISLGRQR